MNQYSATVLLRNADGRTHSVAVVLTTSSPEDAITHAEHLALRTVWEQPGWSVESSWLRVIPTTAITTAKIGGPCGRPLAAGQHWNFCGETDMGQTAPVFCEECRPYGLKLRCAKFAGEKGAPFDEPRPGTDDWPNAHGRRVDHAGNAY